MKKLLLIFALLSCISVLSVACQSGGGTSADAPNTVHMDDTLFLKDTLTIKKGESVVMINDTSVIHIIANGTWDDGTQKPKKEPGAPQISSNISGGQTYTTPPFNTAGTFKLYCTVHPGMNLTVIVK